MSSRIWVPANRNYGCKKRRAVKWNKRSWLMLSPRIRPHPVSVWQPWHSWLAPEGQCKKKCKFSWDICDTHSQAWNPCFSLRELMSARKRSVKWCWAGWHGLYLWDEEESQRHSDSQVGVGEKQQQHPVRVKLGYQCEPAGSQNWKKDKVKKE